MRIRPILSGALALIVLELIVTSSNGPRLAGVFGFPALVASWLIDPTVMGIPNIANAPADGVGATSAPSSPAAVYTPPAASRLPGTGAPSPSNAFNQVA